jgi:hypothetical protein
MVTGLVLCYKARNLPSDFQESAWITVCLVVQFQSLLYAMPILAFTASTPVVTYITKVVFVILNSTGTVLLIFLPKMWAIYGWGAHASSSGDENSSSKGKIGMGIGSFNGGTSTPHGSLSVFNRAPSFVFKSTRDQRKSSIPEEDYEPSAYSSAPEPPTVYVPPVSFSGI